MVGSLNKVSNNKLFDNNLAMKLVEYNTCFRPITIEEIVIFLINLFTGFRAHVLSIFWLLIIWLVFVAEINGQFFP